MRNGNVYVQFLGHILRQSEKAIHFSALRPDGSFHPPEWFPKSQCMSIKEQYDEIEGTYDTLMISEWILSQKTGMLEAQREQVKPKSSPVPAVSSVPTPQPKPWRPTPVIFDDMDDDIPF